MKKNKPYQIIFISLFDTFFDNFKNHSIIKKAIEKKLIKLDFVDLRNFGIGKHKQVDEFQYGPGPGMVLMIEPLMNALEHAKKIASGKVETVLMSSRGKTLKQSHLNSWSQNSDSLILISGNYEGFDERFCEFVDYEISIGDYVLTGGELPSLIVANGVIRLVNGVIKNNSKTSESFQEEILDYPVYTKPLIYKDKKVPEILLSGHHKKIAEWRHQMALKKTKANNPDLLISKKEKK